MTGGGRTRRPVALGGTREPGARSPVVAGKTVAVLLASKLLAFGVRYQALERGAVVYKQFDELAEGSWNSRGSRLSRRISSDGRLDGGQSAVSWCTSTTVVDGWTDVKFGYSNRGNKYTTVDYFLS